MASECIPASIHPHTPGRRQHLARHSAQSISAHTGANLPSNRARHLYRQPVWKVEVLKTGPARDIPLGAAGITASGERQCSLRLSPTRRQSTEIDWTPLCSLIARKRVAEAARHDAGDQGSRAAPAQCACVAIRGESECAGSELLGVLW